jgi:diguanylate cyclase (GGDEF)-like protein
MQNSTWLKPTPANTISGRAWRLDSTDKPLGSSANPDIAPAQRGSNEASISPVPGSSQQPATFGSILRSRDAFRDWICARMPSFAGANTRFEDVLHQFAATIGAANDSATVESALLRLAHKLAPACWIELIPGEASAIDHQGDVELGGAERNLGCCTVPAGQATLEVPLRFGASVFGRIRLRSRSGGHVTLRRQSIERLTTLCTMAACATECLGSHAEWPCDSERPRKGECPTDRSASIDGPIAPLARPAMLIHDATYLNAVLPFALNQARRHRESLSILCMAIDRQRSVLELLGRVEMERLIRHTGEIIGRVIRTSDIVARLDDDRIVAVLPRAPRGGALHVAEKICRAVAENRPPDCSTTDLTVSIGVASFPSCATNVYSLFDAADEALARAQHRGRNQAVVASPSPAPARDQAHAGPCTT